jgi:sugar O-acyltransferase (sialic acid O-acetyltransferase NeuD family)
MVSSYDPLIIIGCGGHGRVVADIARAAGQQVIGFLDDDPEAKKTSHIILGTVRGGLLRYIDGHRFVVAIGTNSVRRDISERILTAGGHLGTLVHPTAILAPGVSVDVGTVVMAGAIVNTGSTIGRFSIINTGAILDHDNLVEDNVHISPGCSLAGGVVCRRNSFIGTGASIIPRVVIGESAVVAAGAAVIRNVEPSTLVAGCPAVEKKHL